MGLIRVVVAAEFLVVMWLDRGGSSNDGRSSGDNSSDSDTTVVIAVLAMDDREGERTQLPNILGPKLSNRTMSRGPRTASHQHLIYHTLPSSSLQVCLATPPPPPHTHLHISNATIPNAFLPFPPLPSPFLALHLLSYLYFSASLPSLCAPLRICEVIPSFKFVVGG